MGQRHVRPGPSRGTGPLTEENRYRIREGAGPYRVGSLFHTQGPQRGTDISTRGPCGPFHGLDLYRSGRMGRTIRRSDISDEKPRRTARKYQLRHTMRMPHGIFSPHAEHVPAFIDADACGAMPCRIRTERTTGHQPRLHGSARALSARTGTTCRTRAGPEPIRKDGTPQQKERRKERRPKTRKKDTRKRTKTRRKEANTNTRNTTRARTQQQHPQTKTQTQEKIRCASCTWLRGNRRKRRISNEIKHCSWGFDSDIGLCGGCCVWKEYGKRTKTSTPFLCCVRETGGGEVPAVEQERQGGGLPHLPYHMQQEI